jgi:hypothetical protein
VEVEIEVKVDEELQDLLVRLIEAMKDLATVIAPLTGYRVIPESEEYEVVNTKKGGA